MSGICGVVNVGCEAVSPHTIDSMVSSLRFKGPDGTGSWVENGVGLGHTLFQTAQEGGLQRQPLSLDGRTFIVADARLDARDDLIAALQRMNCAVSAESTDVELIWRAYSVWGKGCVSRFIGDFVFAIWDGLRSRLVCARDHFGVRPLYFAQMPQFVVFANALRGVLSHPQVPDDLDDAAVGDFLMFGKISWLEKCQTVFRNVRRLPPAHLMVWEANQIRIERYWVLPEDSGILRYRRESEYLEHFRTTLSNCIRDRMRAPSTVVGMSGGLDSTSIAAIGSGLTRREGAVSRLSAFTAVYDKIHRDRERHFASLAARHIGIRAKVFACDCYGFLAPYVHSAEPMEDYTPALSLAIHREISEISRVELTGDGADELFQPSSASLIDMVQQAGPWKGCSEFLRRWRWGQRAPLFGRGRRRGSQFVVAPPYPYPSWLEPDFERRQSLVERWQAFWSWMPQPLHSRHPSAYKALVFPEWCTALEWMPGMDFVPSESTSPYMDLRMTEFCFALPCVPWHRDKHLIRRAMADLLPREVLRRPKTPLGDVYNSLLEADGGGRVNGWKPHPRLSDYVVRRAVPDVGPDYARPEATFLNLRPLLLNTWLFGQYPGDRGGAPDDGLRNV